MLKQDRIGVRRLERYRSIVGEGLLEELDTLAADLKGARVAHISATANGGGVAEILQSLIPLYHDLGIDATWHVMGGDEPFYRVTKQLHNSLQGADCHLTQADWDKYMARNRVEASALSGEYDIVFVHDPQPAAIQHFVRDVAPYWVWRCHIDMSTPNPGTWEVLKSLLNGFDAAVFSLPEFASPDLRVPRLSFITPGIDPLTPKNQPISRRRAESTVAQFGVDPNRPFISQVSRFDPWKDPLGVIECFKLLKEDHRDLQLVLLGNFAEDDPEGRIIYSHALEAAQEVPDVHIITGLTDLVGPFQKLSKVVVQKSLKEGFGLTVAEALWKKTPVVAGKAGGLRLQITDGVGGFLVDSVEECAQKVHYLLGHEGERLALGKAGREHVRSNFLLPRLLRDELGLAKSLLVSATAPHMVMPSILATAA